MNEDKTSIEKLANMNLEGLLLPEPAPVSYDWLWLVFGLLVLITVAAWAKKYRSPKATALRSLKQLQKKLSKEASTDEHDIHNIKKQIARSLRQGFNVTRLDNVMPDNMKWREYLSTLETALYANKPSEPKALLPLIKSAETWLRNS